MNVKSKSGFSLVELMVVVAIIGILATIAVPNFQRFQARSKQTSAKTELSGIFTAQKGFFAEYATYHGHLPAIGYVPEGIQSVADYPVVANVARYYATSAGAGNVPANLAAPLPAAPGGLTYIGYAASAAHCAAATAAVSTGAFGAQGIATATTFLGVAKGCQRASNQAAAAGANQMDVWSINENRVLTNVLAGI